MIDICEILPKKKQNMTKIMRTACAKSSSSVA